MTTIDQRRLDTATLVTATEARDADALARLYAPDATLTILDCDHSPTTPQVFRGRDAIHAQLRDVCGRNVDHEVRSLVADDEGVAFEQHCRYPDGSKVVCVAVAQVDGGLITGQTSLQVWD